MKSLPAPVRGTEQRHGDFREIGAALAIVRAVELARQKLAPHVLSVFLQLGIAQHFRTAHRLASDAALAAFRVAVLHGLHLHLLPVLAERADEAAVARALAVRVVPAFPGADRGEVRWLRGGGAPLVARVVGDAVHADLARAPR